MGLLYLFVPFAALVFWVKFWNRKWVRRSVFMMIGGYVIVVFMAVIFPAVMPQKELATPELAKRAAASGSDIVSQNTVTSTETAANSTTPFRDAINAATEAAQKTQTASSKEDWTMVVGVWQRSIDLLAAVPPEDPNYATAQVKIGEYKSNLAYAQNNAQ